jgi:transposase, IS30 family
MKKNYNQLTNKDRHQLELLISQGTNKTQIAKILKKNRTTIHRELQRGCTFKGKYLSEMTIRKRKEDRLKQRRKRKADNPIINEYIEKGLKNKYSPAIISSQMQKDIGYYMGKDAIYDWAYRGNPKLHQYLTRKHKGKIPRSAFKKGQKELIPNRIDIDLRPQEANLRKEFGHFEADTIFSCQGSLSALLVIVDRLTRHTKIRKLTRKTSFQTSSQIIFALSEYNLTQLHSITYDNGCENTKHEIVNEKLQMQSYFCKPYHSWEKGMVEHVNELIRRHFPKGTNFDRISKKKIQEVENWVNNRPMKVLKFKTPVQKRIEALGVAL